MSFYVIINAKHTLLLALLFLIIHIILKLRSIKMDWSLFFSGLSASATLLILIQLILAYISKRKEHEEQRRQKTVDVLLEWNKSLERETSFAERIV